MSSPHCALPLTTLTRLLSGVKVDSIESLSQAIDALHAMYRVPHVVITSVTFTNGAAKMKCAGSSMTAAGAARKFIIDVPIIDGFYSGTGDLFAALTLARLREHSAAAGLLGVPGWAPPDATPPLELPLARAIEVVLASMNLVLQKTRAARDRELAVGTVEEGMAEHVRVTRASELRLVQSQRELLSPGLSYKATVLL